MAKLYFRIGADFDKVIKLREEIDKLKNELKNMNSTQSPAAFNALNIQLGESTKNMNLLISDAAKAGAVMENDFRKGIYNASQEVNNLTESVINQKERLQVLRKEVESLSAQYQKAGKWSTAGQSIVKDLNIKKAELNGEKQALQELVIQQQEAKLSVKRLKDEYSLYKDESKAVITVNEGIGASFKNILATIGGAAVLKKFVADVVNVRGEFQKTQMSFETMLGSKEKADHLMAQMVETAAKTPFDLKGVANGAKQLLAYGTAAEDVNNTLVRLGNIASGLSIPLGDMVYLYGTTQTQGRLFTQDVRQFMGRGIPLVKELASILGKTEEEINKMVTAGRIGFPEVEKVIKKMTDEGGKFYNLMQKQSETLSGQISNLGEAWDRMLNSIGEDTQGLTSKTIAMATSLIEHYEEIGKVLTGLIAVYGTYKAALILNIALEKAQAVQRLASIKGITTMKMLTDVLTGRVTKLNAALAGKGFALIGAAAVGSSLLLLNWANEQDKCTEAVENFNRKQKEATDVEKRRKQIVEDAIAVASNEKKSTKERADAIEMLKQMYKNIIPEYEKETFLLKDILGYKTKINEEDTRNKRIGVKTKIVMLDQEIAKYEAGLKEANKQGAGQATQGIMNTINNLKKERELYSGLLNDIEKEQTASPKDKKVETKNKEFWANQKKGAETALDAIASAQKNLMDAGKFDGIPQEVIDQYIQAIKLKAEAEKELKVYDSSSKQESAAEKLRKQQEAIRAQNDKLMSLESKQALERQRQQQDLENQLAQSTIDALSDGYDKEKAQRDLNNKKEIQSLNRQKDDYIRAYIQGQKEIFDAGEELKAKKTKGYTKQTFDSSTINVDEIIATWNKIIKNTETQQGVDEWQRREDAMNEYLIEYGTFSQKKEAIDKKYQAAIDKETDLGAKNTLKKKWDEALSALNVDKLKEEINWEMVFGDLSKVTKDQLTNIKKQLQEFKKSPEFQNATPEQIQVIEGAINSINDAMVDKGGFFGGMVDSVKELKIATEELKKAEEELAEANKKGTEAEKEAARKKVNKARQKEQNAETNVTRSSDKTIDNVTKVGSAIAQLGSDAEMSLSSFGNAAANIVDAFTEAGSKIGGLIGAIFSILEGIQKQGLDGFVGNIIGNVASAVGGVLDTLTFGAFGLSGADYSHYNDMVEEYTNLNKIWDELIDKKKEYIDMSYGAEANKAGKEALELVEKSIESYRILGKERLNAGASAGSHSIGVRIRKGMSTQGWNEAKAVLGNTFNEKSIGDGRMTGLFDLSIEQLEKLKYEAPTFWAKLDGDVADYLNNIIEGEARLEDIQNQVKEQLTQTTFDTVFSSFVDTLMDMDSSAKDFSNSFSDYMQRAMLTTMVGDKFSDELQKWYDAFATANDDKDGITKDEMDALKSQYDAIVDSALSEREKLAEIFGWTNEDTSNYENFISNMQSAFTSLDVTAKDISNNIYDYFRQAMINALYEKEYKGKMEELYKTFTDLSKDGLSESDMAQLGSQVDQYIEQMVKGVEGVNGLFADKLKDAEDLQSFVDNVKSAMSSIEATAEDVTDNIFEYIRQQMIDKMFADTFQPQIEEFYKKVQAAMSDGDVTDAERNALRSEAEKLANDIVAAKDILSNTLGITENNLKKELEEEFKSFSDGILNSLTSAEVTAEAVAKNISESMRKELIEAMYVEQYEPRIKAIWEKWKEYSEDGLVTDEERANIKSDIDELSKEVADAAGEISDAWKDSGEEVKKAFDSFSDSIKSVLYDAEATAEDVANNIYKFMRNALVDSMFAAQLQPQIQAWYDQYTKFMEDGAIDTAERKTLDEMIADIQKAGMEIVDAANGLFPSLDTGAIKRAEEAAQEAENARNEAEQEWESFSDDILNSLYDIEATAEDISDDMGEYMRKALIKAMYVENFKPQMQKWYNAWKSAMGDDNLTSEEKQMLDSMKQTMVDDMKKEVDAINQFFGSMFSQKASSKGFEGMSQDTGEELNGRFTALQIAGEEIRNQAVQQTGLLSSINNRLSLLDITNDDIPALLSGAPNLADKTRGIISNSYQSQVNIVFPTEDIKVLAEKVSSMERIVDDMRTFQVEGNMARRDIVENSAILAKNSPKILAGTDDIKRNLKNL